MERMKIIDKIKEVAEQTSQTLHFSPEVVNMDSAIRAKKIIQELVQSNPHPNQIIINDITSLIYALASNPDSSINPDEVKHTADILVNELIKPIKNPDKKLAEELRTIIVQAGKSKKILKKTAGTNPSQLQLTQVMQEAPAAVAATPKPVAPPAQTAPAPPVEKEVLDDSIMKLLMEEMKELIKKHQLLDARTTEIEGKMSNRLDSLTENLDALTQKVQVQDVQLKDITRNLEKFLSLYEVVINQYNPFVESAHPEEQKQPATAQKKELPAMQMMQQEKKAATKPESQAAILDAAGAQITDINTLIEHIKDISDSEFESIEGSIRPWIMTYLNDTELANHIARAKTQAEVVKLLLKKALKINMMQ